MKITIKKALCTLCLICALVYGTYIAVNLDNVAKTVSVNIEDEIKASEKVGQLYIELVGADKDNAPSILINGKSVCVLKQRDKTLDIYDGCVVELDTRGLKSPVMLTIKGKSANVCSDCEGRVITGNGDIQNVGTFVIEKER